MALRYRIPAATTRAETEVSRSRFIATIANVESVEAARTFIASIRAEMLDASHHVYAFKIGYGPSVTEGSSDDGEPSGTSGPPVLAVLRGADIGDAVIVVSRYFGGTKLGTGGLSRAYRDAAQAVLHECPLWEKIEMRRLRLTIPYSFYERTKLLIAAHHATVDHEQFEVEVRIEITMPLDEVDPFTAEIRELSAGKIAPAVINH